VRDSLAAGPSWPGLSRPSTRNGFENARRIDERPGVDARDKRGHDVIAGYAPNLCILCPPFASETIFVSM
jgi:hypothetical protein